MLGHDRAKWQLIDNDQFILLPFKELREISANRRRWIDYAKVLEND